MRYLTLAEAVTIAEAVTGIEASTLTRVARLELLDSALRAPQEGFAMLSSTRSSWTRLRCSSCGLRGITRCPTATSKLAWQALTVFCALNGQDLRVQPDDAVETMLAIAAGELDESAVADWLRDRVGSGKT